MGQTNHLNNGGKRMRPTLLFLLLFFAGCTDQVLRPDQSPDWYVPYKVRCTASCPTTHNRSDLPKCATPGRSEDQTLGCLSLITECFCVAKREQPPAAL